MLKNLLARIKAVMYRMGFIRGIENVFDRKEIPIDENFYNLIDKWKALYSGYHSEFHDVEYKTISGTKKAPYGHVEYAESGRSGAGDVDF